MFKKISVLIVTFVFLFNSIQEVFARAGGRSSFGSGRSSTSHFNQGSRGSRTFEGGGSNGKNYAPMQKSAKQNSDKNSASQNTTNAQNQQNAGPNRAANFFQRNPFLTTVGAVLAGSWLGHMLFGNSGFGGMGASGGGFLINLILMALSAFAVFFLIRKMTRNSTYNASNISNASGNGSNFSQTPVININLAESEKIKFKELLINVQNAWSNQDIDSLKRLTTPEMAKYFSDSLSQNISQGIANKVEEVDVTMINITESWQEDEMQYATAIIEWSAFDYMINLNKNPQDADYIVEGGNRNLVITSEAWTFVRYNSSANWILSAIAQVE
ncbi:MAG: hypothetical protein EBS06_06450 [Proteobacteria bacterium]|nr:hypothetical protein [Pseudomonadota bacterium]